MSEETVLAPLAPATKTRSRVGPDGRQRRDALPNPGAKRNYRNREEGSREAFARRPAAGDQS
ncbi:hypothetical protein OG943_15610 [Amycolatopsis sp. NBC_00345]|uniref:hypothetical protein n=1 Tax=Amycolatopsis sp. NBC_00345 TaxID=2975955 RepID=UPI002E25A7D9